MKKLFTLILFFSYFSIFSQDFKLAFETKTSSVYLKEIGNYKAWLKSVKNTQKIKLKNGKYKTIGGDYLMQLISCDCGSKKISIGKTITYSKNGDVIKELDFISDFEDVVPETQGESVLNIICGWEDYAIDIKLKQLYEQYKSKGNSETFEQFIDAKNQMGDSEFYNFINSQINPSGELKKNKKQ